MRPDNSTREGQPSAPERSEQAATDNVEDVLDPFLNTFDTEHITFDMEELSTSLGLVILISQITTNGSDN
jgi:hypothetical protein